MKKEQKWKMLLLGLSSVFIILAGGFYYISSVQNSLWMQSVTDVREVTAQGGHAFDVYVGKDIEMLKGLALNLGQKNSQDESSIFSRLLAFGEYDAHYYVIDLDHACIYSSETRKKESLSKEQLTMYETFSDSGLKEPYLSDNTGQRILGCYESFQFADGTRGIILKEQLLSSVAAEFSLSFYDNKGFSYIVNNKGDILIRSSHRDSNRTFANVFDVIDLEGNSEEGLTSFRNALQEGKSGVARFHHESEEYVYTYTPLETTDDWYMISIIPNDVIMSHADEVLNSSQIFIFLLVGAILVFVTFVILLWRNRKKVMEKELDIQYREQLFGILANNTDDVFIMLSTANHEVEYVSPNVERVLGVAPEEVKNDLSVLDREDGKEDVIAHYQDLYQMESHSSIVLEGARNHKKTGERRWFVEKIYRANIDNVDKFIVYLSDQTNEKRQKEALEQALEIAEVANQAKSTFLSNMSHDIRTPMNAVVGLCTLLQRDADNPVRVREYTKKITASSQHLLGLINDVLDMSKIESGKTTLNISEINLAEIVDGLGTIIRSQAKAKQQNFEISVFNIQTEHLLGDQLRINQILLNILSNAVKYTQVGGTIDMIIRQMPQTTKNYANLQFIIRDNGMGMSEEYLETIFQPFTRETNSTTNRIQGTGLGMAITKNLVDLMGGTISVESSLGKGSTFIVNLELRIQKQDIDQDFWKKYGLSHVLIVDDEIDVCKNIMGAMADTGLSLKYAVNGQSAIEMVDEAHQNGKDFDIILLDWKMPEMDGIEVAKRIRKIVSSNIQILVLTAYDWSEIEKEALAAGINGFLAKPFFLTNFKQTIATISEKEGLEDFVEEAESILEGKHILAAEDNELNSEILVELLDIVGATCDVKKNGLEALEHFKQSKPGEYDLILMDVQMPIMNGYEAVKAIRACDHPMAQSIPIIAMTANAFAEDIKNALDSGMDAHVAKPIDLDLLETTVQDVFAKKNME